MPLVDLVQTADYSDLIQVDTPQSYISRSFVSSGDLQGLLAEPVGTPYHTVDYVIPNESFSLTIPKSDKELTEMEDKALWLALKDSTKLVRKGRLVK